MIGLLITPSKYFDVTDAGRRINKYHKEIGISKKASPDVSPTDLKENNELRQLQLNADEVSPLEIEKTDDENGKTLDLKKMNGSEYDSNCDQASDDDLSNIDNSFCQRLKSLAANRNYLRLCLSLSVLYFVITGI